MSPGTTVLGARITVSVILRAVAVLAFFFAMLSLTPTQPATADDQTVCAGSATGYTSAVGAAGTCTLTFSSAGTHSFTPRLA